MKRLFSDCWMFFVLSAMCVYGVASGKAKAGPLGRRIDMPALAVLVAVALGAAMAAHAGSSKSSSGFNDLRDQILSIYDKSANECSASLHDQTACVKHQFFLNYRYYVVKDVPSGNGAPGVPAGPPAPNFLAARP